MAERNASFEALVLRTKDSPSGDRIASFLGAEEGIVDAFVFGGAKSSLRALASPFVHARVFLYVDPVKGYRKLTDMSVLESFPALRDSYERLMAASAVSELILRTSGCGGEYGPVLDLALQALRLLDSADPGRAEIVVDAFLWRILEVMGLRPSLEACSSCGGPLGPLSPTGPLRFSESQGGFLCPRCGGDSLSLEARAAEVLAALGRGGLAAAVGEAEALGVPTSVGPFVRSLAQRAAEGGLRSLAQSGPSVPVFMRPGN